MPLVRNGQTAPENFIRLDDDAEIPATGALLVSAARFLQNAEALVARADPVGVIWPNNRELDELQPWLPKLAAVALEFPNFRDGRAYSQARLLRERFKYRGELRAIGQVLRDQFVFMLRAGFDSFDVRKVSDADAFAATARRYTVFYQPTGDGKITALHRRMQLRHAQESANP